MELLNSLYIKTYGKKPDNIIPLQGDGSDRQIYRIIHNEQTIIGIIGQNIEENRAFIQFSRQFQQIGLSVPEIIAVDSNETAYLESDLGDITLYNFMLQEKGFTQNTINMYKMVLSNLPVFQIRAHEVIDYSYCYQHDVFGKDSIMWDFHYFIKQFLEKFYKKAIRYSMIKLEFKKLLKVLLEADNNYFLYRDFQARNVMIVSECPVFIDYQSGRRGALQYDLASLLYDAKAKIPQNIRMILIEYYLDELEQYISLDRSMFMYYFYPYVWTRIMQALGAYGFLSQKKGKTRFLGNIPLALKNIELLLTQNTIIDELPELCSVFHYLVNDKSLQHVENLL